jgi:DNA-binding NtrC family response regulator
MLTLLFHYGNIQLVSRSSSQTQTGGTMNEPKVLIIDDDTSNRRGLTFRLEGLFPTIETETYRDGLDAFREHLTIIGAVVITSIMRIPDNELNAYKLIKAVRKVGFKGKIIVITKYDFVTYDNLMEAGATDLVPFDEHLFDTVHSILATCSIPAY